MKKERYDKVSKEFFEKGKLLQRQEDVNDILTLIDAWYFRTRKKKSYVDLSDVEELKQSIKGEEVKPIILDDNPLSISMYMEEHPEVNFEQEKEKKEDE